MRTAIKIVGLMAVGLIASPQTAAAMPTADESWDQDATVEKRVPPKAFSSRESAYCCVSYTVSHKGKAVDVTTSYCTNNRFSLGAIRTVKRWTFQPATLQAQPVSRPGMTAIITSIATSRNGTPLPGGDGYVAKRDADATVPKAPDGFSERFSWQSTYFNDEPVCPVPDPPS
ncbi:energy transducer TonB [Algimonas porphyrae]|uniref:TonB C-terminal domain-containing protein n=1 Tax=Algimonas porphyrae TaxID=1128113 RepID=A0ABQ5UWX1_9PROT|nr:energy transducer TonB [Algimonas porphyrae]GLQ19781.1 hypothetical protein GCM10007854_07360 [Algimonas porphyrae]